MNEPDSKQKAFTPEEVAALARDPVNRTLLSCLQRDARQSYADLGKAVHLSAPAVFERVRRLERAGLLRYSVEVDAEKLGLLFCAFVRIATSRGGRCDQIVPALEEFPEIEECHSIAGEDSLLVKTRTVSPPALEMLLQRIRALPGAERTLTTVVLKTHFERGVQPAAGVAEGGFATEAQRARRKTKRGSTAAEP